ncbi:hypothetical protein BH10CYA1_BH10CYA1_52830 [soil metagenome]
MHQKEQPRKMAVIDTETTGVYRGRDKIIEIAIVQTDHDGNVEDEYVTLINPNRDLGDTNIHGIRAAEVFDAPTFVEVAGDVLDRLKDRIIVGHNVGFDLGMLSNHFIMMDSQLPPPSNLCTMSLAYQFGPSCRRLAECCSHFGIQHLSAHNALEDARVTLKLLLKYLALSRKNGFTSLSQLSAFRQGEFPCDWPQLPGSGRRVERSDAKRAPINKKFPAELISKLPEAGTSELASYFLLLDRVLEDRRLTDEEIKELTSAAVESGISAGDVWKAHREYVYGLIKVALEDNRITESERADIQDVASMLGFERKFVDNVIERMELGLLTASLTKGPLQLQGQHVCFTGTSTVKINGVNLTRDRAEGIAIQHGLIPVPGVTKKTDILVIADPDSMSGKAKKARELGKRIIAEKLFFRMLDVPIA